MLGKNMNLKNKINLTVYHNHCNMISWCHQCAMLFQENVMILSMMSVNSAFPNFSMLPSFWVGLKLLNFLRLKPWCIPVMHLDKFPVAKCFQKFIQILHTLIWKHIFVNSWHKSNLCANKLSNILVIYLLWKYC